MVIAYYIKQCPCYHYTSDTTHYLQTDISNRGTLDSRRKIMYTEIVNAGVYVTYNLPAPLIPRLPMAHTYTYLPDPCIIIRRQGN